MFGGLDAGEVQLLAGVAELEEELGVFVVAILELVGVFGVDLEGGHFRESMLNSAVLEYFGELAGVEFGVVEVELSLGQR